MKANICSFQIHGDNRGKLIAIEKPNQIPFDIKRIYYIYETSEGVRRGYHAHRNLEQMLICVHGSCKILLDDGYEKRIVELSSPEDGLHLQGIIWREMFDFSPDAVLLVLVSGEYDETDYIRDYNDFITIVKGGNNK